MPTISHFRTIDTLIGFPPKDLSIHDDLRRVTKDVESKVGNPIGYLFAKNIPMELYGADADPISVTLGEMDRFGIEIGLVNCETEYGKRAVRERPDRFLASYQVDPNNIMEEVRRISTLHKELNLRAVTALPSGCSPPVPIDDRRFYPIYAKCCELNIPVFICVGVPGPRLPFSSQHVERVDQVMYDFPDLTFVMRHGGEPWEELAVKLMLKWPGLYYSTSGFSPKYYPKVIIDYMNTRGAEKIIYGGYFPMGLSLERIMGELSNLPLREHVWPKFLRENAAKVLKLI